MAGALEIYLIGKVIMVNILMSRYKIIRMYKDILQSYLKSEYKVVVIAFSFRPEMVFNPDSWNQKYGKETVFYKELLSAFGLFGIQEKQIDFINYYTDCSESAKQKVSQADIIFFTGGLPDYMYERLQKFNLIKTLSEFGGIVMGYSAGAVIQFSEYFISPIKEYPHFAYYPGLPYISDFYIEVHYSESKIQKDHISLVFKEKNKPIYAIQDTGAIIVDNGLVQLLGDVSVFQ